jgi:hypothetical protein
VPGGYSRRRPRRRFVSGSVMSKDSAIGVGGWDGDADGDGGDGGLGKKGRWCEDLGRSASRDGADKSSLRPPPY